jgi:peptide deformylase
MAAATAAKSAQSINFSDQGLNYSEIPATGMRLDPKASPAYLKPMKRPILTAPDPRLQQVSTDVETVDGAIRQLVDDMADSMYEAEGIGLAAIQIGVPKRVIVIDLDQKEGNRNPVAFINPKIVWTSDEMAVFEEGCLSVPEIWDDVERPAKIRAEYLDRNGDKQVLEAEGLLATCLQHEMDHLNGVLFIDHLSRLKRSMAIKKLTKAKKLKETA